MAPTSANIGRSPKPQGPESIMKAQKTLGGKIRCRRSSTQRGGIPGMETRNLKKVEQVGIRKGLSGEEFYLGAR